MFFHIYRLECHGFLCRTSEDSIVIAATLYRSLVSHMTSKSHHREETESSNRKNIIDNCRKLNSSFKISGISKRRKSEKEPNPSSSKPVRPPRKKRPAPPRPVEYCTPGNLNTNLKMLHDASSFYFQLMQLIREGYQSQMSNRSLMKFAIWIILQ